MERSLPTGVPERAPFFTSRSQLLHAGIRGLCVLFVLLFSLAVFNQAKAWDFNADSHISNVKIDRDRGVLTFTMVVYHEISGSNDDNLIRFNLMINNQYYFTVNSLDSYGSGWNFQAGPPAIQWSFFDQGEDTFAVGWDNNKKEANNEPLGTARRIPEVINELSVTTRYFGDFGYADFVVPLAEVDKYALDYTIEWDQLSFEDDGGDFFDDNYTRTITQVWPNISLSGVTASKDVCASVNISWDNATGYSRDMYYKVYRRSQNNAPGTTNPVGTVEEVLADGQGLTSAFDQLEDPKPIDYYYQIDAGYGQNLARIQRYFTVGGPPKTGYNTPTGFAVTNHTCDKITLTWNDATSGDETSQYHITRDDGKTYTVFKGTGKLDITSEVDEQDYVFTIASENNCGFRSPTATATSSLTTLSGPTGLAASTQSDGSIKLTWNNDATGQKKFFIKKSFNGGIETIDNLEPTATDYTDDNVDICQTYDYEIFVANDCDQAGVLGSSVSHRIDLDITNTFDTKNVFGSKGYYTNRVEINWTPDNNETLLEEYRVYRKVLGSSSDYSQVTSMSKSSTTYIDNTTDPGVIYEYLIFGTTTCEGATLRTDSIKTVGFRVPAGIVGGQIVFEGGTGVRDVKVQVTKTSGSKGSSLEFNGTDQYIEVPHTTKLAPTTNKLTLEAWVNPANLTGNKTIISKVNGNTGYGLDIQNSTARFYIYNGTSIQTVTGTIFSGQFSQLTGTYDGTELRLYVNGKETTTAGVTSISHNTSDLIIGALGNTTKSQWFNGNIDEVRIWNIAKDSATVIRDYQRKVTQDEAGLVAYWNFDEAVGEAIYDQSKVGAVFNENHGNIFNTANWSNTTPADLFDMAFTDGSGSYSVPNIRYNGAGETFKIQPILVPHVFVEPSRTVFIGEGSQVLNNQDFLDESSFAFTGRLLYDKDHDGYTNAGAFTVGLECPVEGAYLYIDGNLVLDRNNIPITTQSDGSFEIEVPIGPHAITVGKDGHSFSAGRFPSDDPTDFYNFNDDLATPVIFKDTTKQIVVGRVVGGNDQAAQKPGLGLSKNNIGIAELTFVSQGGTGCYSATVKTDTLSGEYRVELPPYRYDVDPFEIDNPGLVPDISFSSTDGFNMLLDVEDKLELKTVVDTTFNAAGTRQIDSIQYHETKDFIYFATPTLLGLNELGETGSRLVGEKTVNVEGVPTNTSVFPHAIIQQAKDYTITYRGTELYRNYDNPSITLTDTVLITNASVDIFNQLALQPSSKLQLDENGETTYTFKGGNPNLQIDDARPEQSYTRTWTAKLEVFDNQGNKVGEGDWKPDPSEDITEFRGFVFGTLQDGSTFATQGPSVVEFILRDPPGSNSTATLAKGTSYTRTETISLTESNGLSNSTLIKAGPKFETGFIGFAQETEIIVDATVGATTERSVNSEGESEETVTLEREWTTNGDPLQVGARGDLFVGRARAFVFGIGTDLTLVQSSLCGNGIVECYPGAALIDIGGVDYTIGTKKSLSVAPTGDETMFLVTQNAIETLEIPRLELLRNALLSSSKYNSNLAPDNENYGKNNDDPVFGTNPPANVSYTFNNPNLPDIEIDVKGSKVKQTNPANVDSVRWYNQQIRLWQQAIERNEREKFEVIKNTPNPEAFVYSADGVAFTSSKTVEKTRTQTTTIEVNTSAEIGAELGAIVSGVGATNSTSFTMDVSNSTTSSTSKTNTLTTSYTLLDGDEDDRFRINVYNSPDGNGAIFTLEGGETMCPYEGEIKSKYYKDPNTNDFVVLSAGSVQREKPTIALDGSDLRTNVPTSEAAFYEIILGNDNTLDQRMEYHLSVDGNAFGAIVKMDGVAIDTDFAIDALGSTRKIIAVEKGPGPEFKYDDIVLQFHSNCQFADGTSSEEDIFQEVTLRAHFIPGCTQPEIFEPANNFTVNTKNINSDKKTILPISIGNYDINSETFEKILIRYKPTFSTTWKSIDEYYVNEDPAFPDRKLIPRDEFTTDFDWTVPPTDGYYDLQVLSFCTDGTVYESEIVTGLVDRLNPVPFGNPSPADGILSPNDEILIQFNEVIDEGILNFDNFRLKGVINGTENNHTTSVSFNGTSDYMEISEGINLTGTPYIIEMWVKCDGLGTEQTLFSQGEGTEQSIYIGFNAANQLVWRHAGQEIVTNNANTIDGGEQAWTHFAFVFDKANNVGRIYQNATELAYNGDKTLTAEYRGSGAINIGRNFFSEDKYFDGYIHELRIWTQVPTPPDQIPGKLATLSVRRLTGREVGLVGNWPMDEGSGNLARDIARAKNAMVNANWLIDPSGNSAIFDGNGHMVIPGSFLAMFEEEDITVEFWFRLASGGDYTLLSNGLGDGSDTNEGGWAIRATADEKIMIYHNDQVFEAVSEDYFDDQWHHFAMVLNRIGNLTTFIDGRQQNITNASPYGGFQGDLALGATIHFEDSTFSRKLVGSLDEVRIWNTSRTRAQIELDMLNRLTGEETGLKGYWPFDEFGLDPTFGVPQLTATLTDESKSRDLSTTPFSYKKNGSDIQASTGAALDSNVPPVRLQRPVQDIAFTFVANQDKVIITPNVSQELIENITLNVAALNIYDLAGNILQSPKTWIAYVDKNQVVWGEPGRNFTKEIGQPLSFTSSIVNTGGAEKEFTISNIPPWLSVSPSSGSIAPNSSLEVSFTVNDDINIGEFTNSIHLTTDFGFNEVFLLNLTVFKNPPEEWNFDPAAFEFSMSVIGQLRIEGDISIDANDRLGAFVNGQSRGYVNLEYIELLDNYMAFLNVYSNNPAGEEIEFRIWDASEGRVYTNVDPSFEFISDTRQGEILNPIIFETKNLVQKIQPVVNGWQWISFNVNSDDFDDINAFMSSVNAEDGDKIDGIRFTEQYDPLNGWIGTISQNGGLQNGELYKLRVTNPGDLIYEGSLVNPSTVTINVSAGWNWIGFIAQENMEINEALANFNDVTLGDEIKSQRDFAVYGGPAIGWLGSLKSLQPGQGFMLKAQQAGSFVYPQETLNNGRKLEIKNRDLLEKGSLTIRPENYRENMTMIAAIEGFENTQSADTLVALIGNQARGLALPIWNPLSNTYNYFITIHGDVSGQPLRFGALSSNGLYSLVAASDTYFNFNTRLGSLEKPVLLKPSTIPTEQFDVTIFPNPFKDEIELRMQVESDEPIEFQILDLAGKLILGAKLDDPANGIHLFIWDGRSGNGGIVPAGVYLLAIQKDGHLQTYKIIKK